MRILLQSYSFGHANGYYSLGLGYLQSTLLSDPEIAAGIELRILDCDYFDDLAAIEAVIAAWAPDLIGMSVYVWNRDLTERLAGSCRRLLPESLIVCGGRGLSGIETGFLRDNPAVDLVVRQNGERPLVDLVRRLLSGSDGSRSLREIPGITFRNDDGSIIENRDHPAPLLLPAVPSPYLTGQIEPPGGIFYTQTSIFCPNRCTNCNWVRHTGNSPANAYPLGVVRAELEWAVARGHDRIYLFDAAINYDDRRFIGLLDTIDALPDSDASFLYFLNHETINRTQLDRLKRVRKRTIVFLGIETFSPAALALLGRRNHIRQIPELLDRLEENPHVRPVVGLMLGLPGDDLATFLQGLHFFARRPDVGVVVAPLVLAPGTGLRERATELGMDFDREGSAYITRSESFSAAELQIAMDAVNAIADANNSDRVTLGSVYAPVGRISNLKELHSPLLKGLAPDRWVKVGVRGLRGGRAEANGVYRVLPAGARTGI